MSGRELPAGLRLLAIAGTAAALLTFELRRSLRPERREPKLVRSVRNLVIATLAGFVVGALEGPLSHRVARHMEDEELGLAPMISRSPAVRVITAVVALDYGLYLVARAHAPSAVPVALPPGPSRRSRNGSVDGDTVSLWGNAVVGSVAAGANPAGRSNSTRSVEFGRRCYSAPFFSIIPTCACRIQWSAGCAF